MCIFSRSTLQGRHKLLSWIDHNYETIFSSPLEPAKFMIFDKYCFSGLMAELKLHAKIDIFLTVYSALHGFF